VSTTYYQKKDKTRNTHNQKTGKKSCALYQIINQKNTGICLPKKCSAEDVRKDQLFIFNMSKLQLYPVPTAAQKSHLP